MDKSYSSDISSSLPDPEGHVNFKYITSVCGGEKLVYLLVSHTMYTHMVNTGATKGQELIKSHAKPNLIHNMLPKEINTTKMYDRIA